MAGSGGKGKRWWKSRWRWVGVLAYGVGMTVGSAWLAALLAPAPTLGTWSNQIAPAGYTWSLSGRGIWMTEIWVARGTGPGSTIEPPPAEAVVPGEPELVKPKIDAEQWVGGVTIVDAVRTYTFGFPMRSMRWWSYFPPPSGMSPGFMPLPAQQPIDRYGGWQVMSGTANRDAKLLPLSIYWRGFLIDVAVWSGSLALGLELNDRLRRWVRERRVRAKSLCPHCGYSRAGLAGGAVCPECGKSAGV